MIKVFCDICETEIERFFENGEAIPINDFFKIRAEIKTPNNIQICKYCIIDGINQHDDRIESASGHIQFSPEVTKAIKEHCKKTGTTQRKIAKELEIHESDFSKMLKEHSGNVNYVKKLLEYYRDITNTDMIREANC